MNLKKRESTKLMRPSTKNLLQIHIAVLFFGLAGLFGKLVSQSPVIIVLGRVFFASLILGLILFYRKQQFTLKRWRDYLSLGILGVILSIHWITFFQAIQISSVAVGLLTFSTFPVFVTFLEPFVFKEKIKLGDILLALIAFAGIALVIPRFSLDNNVTQGALWGIVSGITFAILTILNRTYVKTYSSLIIAFYQNSVATLLLLPSLFIINPIYTANDILLLALLGIVFTGIAHSLFIQGMVSIRAQTASVIACLEPVYGICAAILLLNEMSSVKVFAGGVIILGVTFYVTITNKSDITSPC